MRRSRSFSILEARISGRLQKLRTKAVAGLGAGVVVRDREFAYVVIELHNSWCNFARSYLLSCLGAPQRSKGGTVRCGNQAIQSAADLLWEANKIARGPLAPSPASRRDEPKWQDVSLFHRTCQELQCSHLPHVQAALSLPARVLQDLPTFRNFYAHRNEETAEKALRLGRQNYMITGQKHPSGVLATAPKNRPQALLLEWIDEMQAVTELLCE